MEILDFISLLLKRHSHFFKYSSKCALGNVSNK